MAGEFAFNMVIVVDHTNPNTPKEGLEEFSDFEIGEYPVLIKEWNFIANWAKSHGYKCTAENDVERNFPITAKGWWEAMLWCNAASEYFNLEPVLLNPNGEVLRNLDDDIYDGWEDWYKWEQVGDTVQLDISRNGYRLPTREEWFWAARGADPSLPDWNYEYAGSNNVAKVAWYGGDDGNGNADFMHEVKLLKPNRLGLYDMSGNVVEWSLDVDVLGGSWYDRDDSCSIQKGAYEAELDGGDEYTGFRLARTLK